MKKEWVKEKQITQFIVNNIDSSNDILPLSLGGGSNIYLRKNKANIFYLYWRLTVNEKYKNIHLGYYWSEDLETYPNLNYDLPKGKTLINYQDILKIYSFLKKSSSYPKLVRAYNKCEDPNPSWNTLMEYISSEEIPEVKKDLKATQESKDVNKKKLLETKLRLIDLQIEREKLILELESL